jgi:hypothetical protein
MKDEMGPDFDDVDWKKLDPRQYDPRRIIREALIDDEPTTPAVRPVTRAPGAVRPEPAYLQHKAKSAGGPVPIVGAGAAAGAVGAASAGAAGAAGAPGTPSAAEITGDADGSSVDAAVAVPVDAAGAAGDARAAYDTEAT